MLNKYQRIFEDVKSQELDQDKKTKPKKGFIDFFGQDMTEMARNNELSPVIGREKEINQIIWVLSRKNKNNPVIVGEAGVGKTAIVEGIAQQIVSDECPESLKGKRIIYLDMATIMSSTPQQGDLEKRILMLIKELKEDRDIILFIDEVHLMVDKNLNIDMANMVKPSLARGEMRLIGATTNIEYKQSIETDNALERRFQKVFVEPTNVEDTIKILNKIKGGYEEFHKVRYSNDAITSCVKLSDKYITNRFFPDKAIDLLDEVGAKVRISKKKNVHPNIKEIEIKLQKVRTEKIEQVKQQKFEESAKLREIENKLINELEELNQKHSQEVISDITSKDVESIISLKTGIPINKLNKDQKKRLMSLEKDLNFEIIGQNDAVSAITRSIKRSRSGLNDPKKPNGVFLFLGTTGTGKTHTVKMLAKNLFQSENDVIRIDMSEYAEKHNVSRLIGSPPGYVGYGEGGQLTEKVRRKPYSIILFDELEKAHPSVLNTMLQIFDDGHLTDGEGRKVDFKNTVIIMTSNIGSESIKKMEGEKAHHDRPMIGFTRTDHVTSEEEFSEDKKSAIMRELRQKLSPEFLNRIDDVIIFNPLSEDSMIKIIDLELNKLSSKLTEMGYSLTISEDVKKFLIKVGYDVNMGARPLKRTIQKYLEDPISDGIISDTIIDEINIDLDGNQIIINGDIIKESKKIITKFKVYKYFK